MTTLAPPARKHFTRAEYHFLADSGLLDDARYELLDGDIIAQMPQKEPHGSLVMAIVFLLAAVFGSDYLRCQMPVVLASGSEPEPDVLVTTNPRPVYQNGSTPTGADVRLLVEVSVSTLAYDTGDKAAKYALAGIADYWVVDADRRRLLVYRAPVGGVYPAPTELTDTDTVSPLAAPQAVIAVADLLP